MILGWEGAAICGAMVLFASWLLWRLRQYWRGDFPARIAALLVEESTQGTKLRVSLSAMPISAVVGLVFFGSLLAASFVGRSASGYVAIAIGFGCGVLYVPVCISVVLYNRPGALVPPIRRGAPGLLEEMRRRGS